MSYLVLSVMLILSSLGTVTVVYIFAGVVYTFYSGSGKREKKLERQVITYGTV